MRVQTFSDKTYWNALALSALGKHAESTELLHAIDRYARAMEKAEPKIDYFATSLPAMLLFEEDLGQRNHITALFLRAQACLGLGLQEEAMAGLKKVLSLDGNHSAAADLLQSVTRAGSSWQGGGACTSPTLPR
jgi:tetratricopeptide (TPR) repeat protein